MNDEGERISYVHIANEIARNCDNCDQDQPIGSEMWVDGEGWHLCPSCWRKFYDYPVDRPLGEHPPLEHRFCAVGEPGSVEWIPVSREDEFVELEANLTVIFNNYVRDVIDAYKPVAQIGHETKKEILMKEVDAWIEYIFTNMFPCNLSHIERKMVVYMCKHFYNDIRLHGTIVLDHEKGLKTGYQRIFAMIEQVYVKEWLIDDIIHCFEMQSIQRGRFLHE